MEPITFAVLLVAGAAGLVGLDRKYGEKKQVSQLQKGKNYSAKVVVTSDIAKDPRWTSIPVGTTPDDGVRLMLTSTFDQSGAYVTKRPEPLNANEYAKFLAGQPSVWAFDMTWNVDSPYVTAVIPWISNAAFFGK